MLVCFRAGPAVLNAVAGALGDQPARVGFRMGRRVFWTAIGAVSLIAAGGWAFVQYPQSFAAITTMTAARTQTAGAQPQAQPPRGGGIAVEAAPVARRDCDRRHPGDRHVGAERIGRDLNRNFRPHFPHRLPGRREGQGGRRAGRTRLDHARGRTRQGSFGSGAGESQQRSGADARQAGHHAPPAPATRRRPPFRRRRPISRWPRRGCRKPR